MAWNEEYERRTCVCESKVELRIRGFNLDLKRLMMERKFIPLLWHFQHVLTTSGVLWVYLSSPVEDSCLFLPLEDPVVMSYTGLF